MKETLKEYVISGVIISVLVLSFAFPLALVGHLFIQNSFMNTYILVVLILLIMLGIRHLFRDFFDKFYD